MNQKSEFLKARAQIVRDYKDQVAKAQLEARKRMHVRIRHLEAAYDVKAYVFKKEREAREFKGKGVFASLFREVILEMPIGTKFTLRSLWEQLELKGAGIKYGSISSALTMLCNTKYTNNAKAGTYKDIRGMVAKTGNKKLMGPGEKESTEYEKVSNQPVVTA